MDKKKIFLSIILSFTMCLSIFMTIKICFFNNVELDDPIKNIKTYYKEETHDIKYASPTTKINSTTTSFKTTVSYYNDENNNIDEDIVITNYPYEIAPTFEDDGSIIYDGLTLTELTSKLNKSLNGYLMNTGYFFAKKTKDTGMDPYLSVSIVLLESGCKWTCSYLTVECNNIAGLKGGNKCNGGSYSKYETLEAGINGYLNIIYNNYYLKGLDTPEKMASKYAQSSTWAEKVNKYIEEVKSK